MKKLLRILVIGMSASMALTACDSGQKETGSTDAASSETVAAKSAEVVAEQPAASPEGRATPFAENALSMTVGGNCSLDAVNGNAVADGKIQLKRGESVVVSGWAADQAGAVPTQPQLVIHNDVGGYASPLATGIARADVAAAMKNPALANSGFESPLSLGDVPAGVYDLSVVVTGEAARRCPLNTLLTVTD